MTLEGNSLLLDQPQGPPVDYGLIGMIVSAFVGLTGTLWGGYVTYRGKILEAQQKDRELITDATHTEIESLRTALKEHQEDVRSRNISLDQEWRTVEKALVDAKTEAHYSTIQCGVLEKEIKDLQLRHSKAEQRIEGLSGSLQISEKKNRLLERMVEVLQNQNSILSSRMEDTPDAMLSFQGQLRELESKINSLEERSSVEEV